jgi:CrcB protein
MHRFALRHRLNSLRENPTLMTILVLALGATLGAAARYYVTLWMTARFGAAFPYGTLLINVLGSFLLGAFVTLSSEWSAIGPELRLLVATGFCGSFTTFSTFSNETLFLLTSGHYIGAVVNVVGSVLLGLGGAVLGVMLMRALLL